MALILSGDTGVPASGMPTGSIINTYFIAGNTQLTLASTSQTDVPNLSITLTPTSSSSKFIIFAQIQYSVNGNATQGFGMYAVRNGTNVQFSAGANYETYWTNANFNPGSLRLRTSQNFYDSPATASSITYKIQVAGFNTNTMYINNDSQYYSTLTIQEIR
jgi:hypothetical protein